MNLNLIPQSRTLKERLDKGTPPLTCLGYLKRTSIDVSHRDRSVNYLFNNKKNKRL